MFTTLFVVKSLIGFWLVRQTWDVGPVSLVVKLRPVEHYKYIRFGYLPHLKLLWVLDFKLDMKPVAFVPKSNNVPAVVHSLYIVLLVVLSPLEAAERSSPTETFPFDPNK